MSDTKPTNPKDALGSKKLPLGVVPATGDFYSAEALLEGACKYGRYNWRIAGVRASIYYDAQRSHVEKWWNGQDRDPTTLVHELGSARTCLDILIDAIECGMLTDDRPPSLPVGALEKLRNSPTVAHLLAMYPPDRAGAPKQFTIADTTPPRPQIETQESPRESPRQLTPPCSYYADGVCEDLATPANPGVCSGCGRFIFMGT